MAGRKDGGDGFSFLSTHPRTADRLNQALTQDAPGLEEILDQLLQEQLGIERLSARIFEDYYRKVKCPILMLPGEEELENEREMAVMKGLREGFIWNIS